MKVSGLIMLAGLCTVWLVPCALDGVTFQEPGMPWMATVFALMPLTLLMEIT